MAPPLSRAQDSDQEIGFAEFLVMDRRSDPGGTSQHKGFDISKGIVASTKRENESIIKKAREAQAKIGAA